ncbi:hypothetical protein GS885_21725 [Rhodococcus hoagii]|nr:hypothetical protein [Prescottella equi]
MLWVVSGTPRQWSGRRAVPWSSDREITRSCDTSITKTSARQVTGARKIQEEGGQHHPSTLSVSWEA